MKTTVTIEKTGKFIAVCSLMLGTIMFLIYFFSMSAEFAVFSYFLLILIAFINLILLLVLLIKFFRGNDNRNEIRKTMGMVLLNIPIAMIYFYAVIYLTNFIRLTVTNKTNLEIKNLSIKGCEKKKIESLKNNESATVWIKIPNDCSIYATYHINGKPKNEEIFGYVTPMMGRKQQFELGVQSKPLDSGF